MNFKFFLCKLILSNILLSFKHVRRDIQFETDKNPLKASKIKLCLWFVMYCILQKQESFLHYHITVYRNFCFYR
jgi:hypothetical protein